jgi:hypothetical protein
MQSFINFGSSSILRWWLIVLASALGIAAASFRVLESEDSKRKRTELKRRKELQSLAQKIAIYGQTIHRQFPTGDVVVSEKDLAEQLRKRPDVVATALNFLLNQRKVERAPLGGYWKLNV